MFAGRVRHYRDRAEECRRFGMRASAGDIRESFLQIAVTYETLADDLEQTPAAQRSRRIG